MIVDTALREREAKGQPNPRRDGWSRRDGPRHRPTAWHASTGNSPCGDRESDTRAWLNEHSGGRRHRVALCGICS